jgi:hypothetical protein
MSALAVIKPSSILGTAADAAAGNYPAIYSTSATVSVDVSSAGSPGNLEPDGFVTQTGVAKWVDKSGAYPIGWPSFSMSVRPPVKTSRVTRVFAKYVSPTLEVTSPSTSSGIQPAPTKAYDAICNIEFVLPERMTLAEREAFYSRVLSLMVARVQATDGAPSDATGSPLPPAVLKLDRPW